jgi:hypothetical protein
VAGHRIIAVKLASKDLQWKRHFQIVSIASPDGSLCMCEGDGPAFAVCYMVRQVD